MDWKNFTEPSEAGKKCNHIRIKEFTPGVPVLFISTPGKSVNLISSELIEELDLVLEELSLREDLRGVVITSSKRRSFVAGADVEEIDALQDRGSIEDAYRYLEKSKATLNKLRGLGVEVVAAIRGACKGGGLELALWCSKRIAVSGADTAFALPEVRLGLMPGFGGCVLLPRLINSMDALQFIAKGADINSDEAWQLGIIDEIVEPFKLLDRAISIALGSKPVRCSKKRAVKAALPERIVAKMLNLKTGKGRLLPDAFNGIVSFAHSTAASPVLGSVKALSRGYRAPAAAAACVLKTLDMPLEKALSYESAAFTTLAFGTESSNLVDIFLDRSRVKKLVGKASADCPREIAVVGAGLMGREIVFEACCSKSIEKVVVLGTRMSSLEKALAEVKKLMDARVEKGKLSTEDAELNLAKITLSVNYSDIADCDAVIEAVPEDYESKFAVYTQIDAAMAEQRKKAAPCYIFSNTSALELTKLAGALKHPECFSGLHFFNPVSQMLGVEIPSAQQTSPQTSAVATALVSALGKTPLPCKEYPGFIVNAMLGPYMNAAICLLSMGVPADSIDRAMKSFGMPMGPIELMDYVGLDTVLSVARTLNAAHGERLSLPQENIVASLEQAGSLGRKSGKGFYTWKGDRVLKTVRPPVGLLQKLSRKLNPASGKREAVFNPEFLSLQAKTARFSMSTEAIQELLVAAIENEAVRLLEAGVVSHPFVLDLAFIISTGFTASTGGPIRHIDYKGVRTFCQLSDDIAASGKESWRLNYRPCELLRKHAESGLNLYH